MALKTKILLFKQGRKRPQICIKCDKRGTFGERKSERKRKREREIESEKQANKAWSFQTKKTRKCKKKCDLR